VAGIWTFLVSCYEELLWDEWGRNVCSWVSQVCQAEAIVSKDQVSIG
jgi:hypothetical protein